MRWQAFTLPDEVTDYLGLINLEGVTIRSHTFTSNKDQKGLPFDRVHVLYEYQGEASERDMDKLQVLMDKARIVAKDPEYSHLKNQKQREIFLLAKYNISNGEAETVMELLKKELSSVLAGNGAVLGVA